MRTPDVLLRAGLLAAVLSIAGTSAGKAADGYRARDASGATVNLMGHTLGSTGGIPNKLPGTSLTDPAGNDIGGANPLPVGPGITIGTPANRSVTITGSLQTAMAANTTRKGGFCQASYANTGMIGLSAAGNAAAPPSLSNEVELAQGQSFDLNQHGYVEQTALTVVGTHAGDILLCQEVQ